MASIFQDSVDQSLQDQKWWVTYKGSLLIILSGVVTVLADLAQSQDIKDLGWATGIGIASTLGAFLLNRFTRDGVTRSAAARLEEAGMKAHLNRVSQSGVVAVVGPLSGQPAAPVSTDPALPVYEAASTADDDEPGKHRVEE